jgi:hypothetical protein
MVVSCKVLQPTRVTIKDTQQHPIELAFIIHYFDPHLIVLLLHENY